MLYNHIISLSFVPSMPCLSAQSIGIWLMHCPHIIIKMKRDYKPMWNDTLLEFRPMRCSCAGEWESNLPLTPPPAPNLKYHFKTRFTQRSVNNEMQFCVRVWKKQINNNAKPLIDCDYSELFKTHSWIKLNYLGFASNFRTDWVDTKGSGFGCLAWAISLCW